MATFLTSLKIGTLKEKTAVATFGVALETVGNFLPSTSGHTGIDKWGTST